MDTNNTSDFNTFNNFTISKSLDDNIKNLKDLFKNDSTINFRLVENQFSNSFLSCIVYVNGLVDNYVMNDNLISPIMTTDFSKLPLTANLLDLLQMRIINSGEVKKTNDTNEIITSLLQGSTLLFINNEDQCLIINAVHYDGRDVSKPETERSVRGPNEAFNESIIINISLIRKKLKNPNLKFIFKELGEQSKTKICITYIEGIVDQQILNEVIKRIEEIDIDAVLDSGYIEEFIKDHPLSPFKTVGNTERPDVLSSKLLEGRIGIICDGSPFALTVPYIFVENFQANEDYYNSYIVASINRFMRYIGFFLTTSTPAIFLALTSFHHEMIPTTLLLSITASREGVPFPIIIEALLMLFIFDVLKEAGIRLPNPIGQAVSIVGALVLGQAAISAKIIGAMMVIVVGFTGITSFMVSKMNEEILIPRIIFLILSTFLGLYGYVFGVIGLFTHLVSIKSFGVCYMTDFFSLKGQEVKDTIIRAPWWYMEYRSKKFCKTNPIRLKKKNRVRG